MNTKTNSYDNYQRQKVKKHEQNELNFFKKVKKINHKQFKMLFIIIFIVLLVVGLLYLWWQKKNRSPVSSKDIPFANVKMVDIKKTDFYQEKQSSINQNLEKAKSEKDVGTLNQIAQDYFLINELDKAERYYQRSLKIAETAESYFGLGQIFHERGDYKKAMEHYEQAIVLDNEHKSYLIKAAGLASDLSDFRKAHNYYLRALGLEPRNKNILLLLAQSYEKSNNYGLAQKTYLKILKIDSNHRSARLGLDRVAKKIDQ